MIAGRYSLDREIGRGGMGAVWLSHDEVLGRQVALKRIGLLPGADSTDLARAEREARLAARLNHPHVVAIYNVVSDDESDARWLVMEYVEGPTLAQLVKDRGRLRPDEAAPLLGQVADALVAAHAVGIVHRDVKPSNILVDRNGRAKLTDFGIARVSTDPSLTQTGLVTGSPAYLAPEVAAGQRGDASVDVWSLGATIFHVLSGRPPYDIGENVIGGLYRVVHEEPPRPEEAGWLTPLLEGTMVREPSRRWSMTQVRDFLADGPGRGVVPAGSADDEATRSLTAVRPAGVPTGGTAAPAPRPAPEARAEASAEVRKSPRSPGPAGRWLLVGLSALVLALVVALVLVATLPGDEPAPDTAAESPSATPSEEPTDDEEQGPTEQGMETFIRDYVATVSSDPDAAWQMLTPKFQRESGGLDTYRDFWSGVGDPEILEVSADPDILVVSYRVRFENFGTGQRPTVLDLVYDEGRYLIDGERTEGFEPAG